MTKSELQQKIGETEWEIQQLEKDIPHVKNESSKKVLEREVATFKHVLKQYKKMKEMTSCQSL